MVPKAAKEWLYAGAFQKIIDKIKFFLDRKKNNTWRTKDISHNASLMHSQAEFNAASNYEDVPIYCPVLISSKHLSLYEAVIYLLAGCSGHKSNAKTRSSFTELSADRLRSINQEYYSGTSSAINREQKDNRTHAAMISVWTQIAHMGRLTITIINIIINLTTFINS